jgi:4-hydroxybenzoate polyprenyltransferase
MIGQVRLVLEMIRFSHTIFALPFALLSAALAWQGTDNPFHLDQLLGILLCMVFARSAAMAFNRLVDRKLDALNPRTASRHLPTGRLTTLYVAGFTVLSSMGFVASTLIFMARDNPWPLYLAGPVLLFLFLYSYTKRFTILAHFWLGSSLMLAPLAAWIAIRGMQDPLTPMLIGLAVLFWVAGFDIIYACQDEEFDRRSGLFSVPARFGARAALLVAACCHLITIGLLVALWATTSTLGFVFLAGVGTVATLLLYEHWLVRPDDLSRVNKAFFYVNGAVSLGLLSAVVLQLIVNSMAE